MKNYEHQEIINSNECQGKKYYFKQQKTLAISVFILSFEILSNRDEGKIIKTIYNNNSN